MPGILAQPPLSAAHCVGLGVVTSIDPARQILFVATPVPQSQLQHVNTLLKGQIDLPVLMRRDNARKAAYSVKAQLGDTPYYVLGSVSAEGSGGTQMKARKNLERNSNRQ